MSSPSQVAAGFTITGLLDGASRTRGRYPVSEIAVADIADHPANAAYSMDPAGIAELAESIREDGLTDLPLVRKVGAGSWQMVSGHRRKAAYALLAKGDAEVGFADGLYYFAYEGKGQFDGKPMKNIRGLVPLYAEPIHFLVAKGSGIKSLKDLKGKRVSVGAVGSGTEVTVRTLLKVNGIDPDKDIKAENLGLSDTATAFADKNIDAGLTVGALGIAGVVEITTIGTAELIDFEPGAVKNLCKELPYYLPFDIPANTYKGQTKPVKAMASWNILVVKDDLDKDLAYNMTKALFEKKKDILNVSTRLASMAPEYL